MYQDDIDCADVQGCNLVIRNNKYGNLRQSATSVLIADNQLPESYTMAPLIKHNRHDYI
jgi:hypothetical protein